MASPTDPRDHIGSSSDADDPTARDGASTPSDTTGSQGSHGASPVGTIDPAEYSPTKAAMAAVAAVEAPAAPIGSSPRPGAADGGEPGATTTSASSDAGEATTVLPPVATAPAGEQPVEPTAAATAPGDGTDTGPVDEPAPAPVAGPADAPAEGSELSPAAESPPTDAPESGTAAEAESGPHTDAASGPDSPSAPGGSRAQRGPGRPAGPRGRGPGRPGGPGAPGGRPGRPGGPGAAPVTPGHGPGTVVEPIVEPVDPHQWGRIDDAGVVYVNTAAGERAIGNWQAGDAEAGLSHFGRRYDDFSTEIALLEARLASGTGDPKATKQQAVALRESVDALPAIGDLDGAAARLENVIGAAELAISGASIARTQARANAVKAKEALCEEAEALADSTQWKTAGDRLKSIVDEWRAIRGIDRKTDDALWKRFAKARDTFTRRRGSHFAELDKQRVAAKDAKEALITRAEALSGGTDWGQTAAAYRTLMDEWKAVGRAPRDVEDALWARFRAAQEQFFSRRNETFSARDAEFGANAEAKDKLLAEAEKIDPAQGLDQAKAALRSVQERWEAAGKVPRERIREFDGRLRAVEDKVRQAEERHWRRTDPETEARVAQFRSRAEGFRAQAAKARAAGDERKAKDAERQAEQWEEWLRAAEQAVDH